MPAGCCARNNYLHNLLRDKLPEGIQRLGVNAAESFQRRVRALVEAAGGKKPLARAFGVTDSAITSWLAGSKPFESKLRLACERSGVSLRWLRDGIGMPEPELGKVTSHHSRRIDFQELNGHGRDEFSARVREDASAPAGATEAGWRIVVRVLADRLTSTQIAEALNEVLAQSDIEESVRNSASQILVAAQLPKLKR